MAVTGAAKAMKNRATIVVVVLLVSGIVGWQVTACYVANSELQSEMQDLAVQNPARIGLAPLASEQQLRDSVIAKAKSHGIELDPQQVAVHLTNTPEMYSISLEAEYEARVNLLVYSFGLHFTPHSSYSAKFAVR